MCQYLQGEVELHTLGVITLAIMSDDASNDIKAMESR